jgi:hypothetical protein
MLQRSIETALSDGRSRHLTNNRCSECHCGLGYCSRIQAWRGLLHGGTHTHSTMVEQARQAGKAGQTHVRVSEVRGRGLGPVILSSRSCLRGVDASRVPRTASASFRTYLSPPRGACMEGLRGDYIIEGDYHSAMQPSTRPNNCLSEALQGNQPAL